MIQRDAQQALDNLPDLKIKSPKFDFDIEPIDVGKVMEEKI